MRDKILECAELMVQDRGLNAISFQQLADAVGLSKPSVFHHFRNKESLALGLVERCSSLYGPRYDAVVHGDGSAPEKLRALLAMYREGLESERPCLQASLGNAVTTLPESVQVELRQSITATVERITRIFEQGRREESLRFKGSPKDAAAGLLGLFQGLQTLARAQKTPETFVSAAKAHIDGLCL